MPRKGDRPQSARHVHIYDDDWELLERAYGRGGANPIGIAAAIRIIIADKCKRLREVLAQQGDVIGNGDEKDQV